jgi:hypothetical protein
MRHVVYEILGLMLVLAGVAFFYVCVEFLAEKDYIAGVIVVVLGFGVLRTGVELSKMSVLLRREESE